MKPFTVFNAEVNNKATKIFGGEASGLCDWDDTQYPIMFILNEEMWGELWSPQEINLDSDLKDYRTSLSEREREVYNIITGYLTQLDSIANKFNFVTGYICTDPSVQQNIQLIGSSESMHNRAYQYLTSTMLNDLEKKLAFTAPLRIERLIERNDHIIRPIQELVDYVGTRISQPEAPYTKDELFILFKGILGNLILEGLYFTGGFTYFHSLARDNRMLGSNDMINLIKEDEMHHNKFWGQVIRILMLENPEINNDEVMDYALNFIRKAVELEKEWSTELFDGIYTMSIEEYHDYVEYLANVICNNAGIKPPYPENLELRSPWILKFGSKSANIRTDNFEGNNTDYGNEGGAFDF